MSTALYRIENNGQGSFTIRDANGLSRTLRPGEMREFTLTENVAARYAGAATLNVRDKDGRIPPEYVRPSRARDMHVPREDAAGPAKRVRLRLQEEVKPFLTRPQQATELMRMYNDKEISYSDLSARTSKLVAADKWPGGTPKRSVLFDLLNDVTNEPAENKE